VNLKILLSGPYRRGEIDGLRRDALLISMTDEVASLVLADNYDQTLALSVAETAAPRDIDADARYIRALEAKGKLDRAVEFLPNDADIQKLENDKKGLTRPELAILMAYAKLDLDAEILESTLPDDPAFAATLAAYFPALAGSWLWDDAGHVTAAPLQSWTGLYRIWFEIGATQQYYPLLHSAFWIEHRIWGDAPVGYHLVNVLWHATSACLLAAILRRLAIRGAVLAALVFALHPVGVESVAWIAEQKNTLSTVFYLAAALAWLRFEDDRRPDRYAVALLWFVAALLTKSVTATLPAALLVVAWWRRGRLSWRGEVRPLLPWLLPLLLPLLPKPWKRRPNST